MIHMMSVDRMKVYDAALKPESMETLFGVYFSYVCMSEDPDGYEEAILPLKQTVLEKIAAQEIQLPGEVVEWLYEEEFRVYLEYILKVNIDLD